MRHASVRHTLAATAMLAGLAFAPRDANAHFTLQAPACYSQQDQFGSPQKSGPCGQADPGAAMVPTNTAYLTGGSITLTINETIPHPGHYRIAIANDMASLPAEPPVTAGSTPCGSTVIDPNPTLPVLADGVFVHTSAFSGPQTMQIPLPAGFTCDHCVLQVLEFMSNHGLNNPGGCFYHHCAIVTVADTLPDAGAADASTSDAMVSTDSGARDASTASDASMSVDASQMDSSADGSTTTPPANGCGCRTPRGDLTNARSIASLALVAMAAIARRRRRAA